MRITGHMVVKNEDRFLWYAIRSVLDYLDVLFITDTGSTDDTRRIIQNFNHEKIKVRLVNTKNPREITEERSRQLRETQGGYLWMIDGDEVYPGETAKEIRKILKKQGKDLNGVIVRRYDLLGDIYHCQDDSAGYYDLFGKRGHFALRLINLDRLQGLKVKGNYPYEGYYQNGREIIHFDGKGFVFTRKSLFHAMYLQRSSKGKVLPATFHRNKYKYEKGLKIKGEDLPEVFWDKKRPQGIADVTQRRGLYYEIYANILTPFKKIKRQVTDCLFP